MNKKIKLALVYKKNYNYFQPDHFDKTTADFFLKSFERNENLEVTYHPCEKTFDTKKLKGKCDVILLPNNRSDGAPDKLENIEVDLANLEIGASIKILMFTYIAVLMR